MSGINFERLDDAITYGFEHPDEFEMRSWFERWKCGTTACLAGTAALQDGWRPVFKSDFTATSTVERGGRSEHVEHVAAALLGLADDQCDIFGSDNLDEVIDIRNRWAVEAGVPERTWGDR
jgi:hypothetical protein